MSRTPQRAVVAVVNPEHLATAELAVIVPARDEEERIGACLASLARQVAVGPIAVSLCVNNATDATARRAEAEARRLGLCLVLSEVAYRSGGVGRARRIGHSVLLRRAPAVRALLSTDADCTASPDWALGLAQALTRAPVVLGGIAGNRQEVPPLPESYFAWSGIEDAYCERALEFERLLDPEGEDGIGLNTAGGASLGFRRDAYLALGGFRALETGEDRDIVARALAAGLRPVRAPQAMVTASMRPAGRAPGGMADRIAGRLLRRDIPLDAALLPFDRMVAKHVGGGPQPLAAPLTREAAARDLPALTRCVARLRRCPDPAARRRYLATLAQAGATDSSRELDPLA